MQSTNFKCSDCGSITESYKVSITSNFPTTVKCNNCSSVNTYRIWSVGDIAVAPGKNSLGYTEYSKFGKYKGERIKTI